MTITNEKNNGKLIVAVEGRLDTNTAPELESFLKENYEGITELILDLELLKYVSSAGLRVLLSAQKTMKKQGAMKVIHVCPEIMEVFEITGFADVLTIE